MSETVDKVKADIEARINELEPLVEEYERLVNALEGIKASEPKNQRKHKRNKKIGGK